MPDVSILFNALDLAARALLFASGCAAAVHYMLMANFMRRAPHVVKALALPALTASGVGMAVCGVINEVAMGMTFGTIAAGLMVFVNLAAWQAGAYVSSQFDRAAQVREQISRDGWAFVRQFDQMADVAGMLDAEGRSRKTERQK